MNHIMLDLETMGTRPGSALVALGACAFDPNGELGEAPPRFYKTISLASCQAAGLRVDAGTVMWWLQQEAAPRAALAKDPRPVGQVLKEFAEWFEQEQGVHLWGHGASFDPVLVESAMWACGLQCPWKFYNFRDTRTLFALADAKGLGWMPERAGTHHNALDDALHQARAVQAALKYLGLKL